jgi:Fe-S oxidoreductase
MEKLFDPFVLLFTAGFSFAAFWFIYKVIRWFLGLSASDRQLVLRGIISVKTLQAVWETVSESLLHRKIFRRNLRLGYMHMSLAFGWFMLIVIGNVESTWYSGSMFKPIYVSVFWRFFDPGPSFPEAVYQPGFAMVMDLFLLLVLSGLGFAVVKRFRSKVVGMKRTTKQHPTDRLALTALWMIFPARLIAESMTCGAYGTGSFLTGSLGYLISQFFDPQLLVLPAWWFYSAVLCAFFVFLPFSRYAHIPSEPVLIFFRKYGVKVSTASTGYTDLSLHACSSCGVCIDACQLSEALPGRPLQSNYFVKSLRHDLTPGHQWDCMMCGRCEAACPVGVDLMPLRQQQRPDSGIGLGLGKTGYAGKNGHRVNVVYFAGCMTHLTPGIIASMKEIFTQAGAKWQFFDADGNQCCGRPLKLGGQAEAARNVRLKLESAIRATGASLLVTSCPICLRMFREEYDLGTMRVVHHSQYINELLEWNFIRISKSGLKAAYHEPCELGRGSGIRQEPRKVVSALYSKDVTPSVEGLCCGGSLGGPALDIATRKAVARGAVTQLTANEPDLLITSCPLCKKTFQPVSQVPVKDIAEATAACMVKGERMPGEQGERRKAKEEREEKRREKLPLYKL